MEQTSPQRLHLPSIDQILTVTGFVWSELPSFELDDIDGEFYWRCCRADLLSPLAALPSTPPRAFDQALATATVRDRIRFLREIYEWAEAAFEVYKVTVQPYPGTVLRKLWHGRPIPMRIPDISDRWSYDEIDGFGVRVYSGTQTGTDVETALFTRTDIHARWFLEPESFPERRRGRGEDAPVDEESDSSINDRKSREIVTVKTNIEFEFVAEPDPRDSGALPGTPYIEVRLRMPLPASGTVAREYDRAVRDENRWHLRLPGEGSRQQKEVAVRTWALGLLTRGGMKYIDAGRVLKDRTGMEEVTQTCFFDDRARLVERVPEARPYLYTRDRRRNPLANHPSAESG